jgi:hypothetical protein
MLLVTHTLKEAVGTSVEGPAAQLDPKNALFASNTFNLIHQSLANSLCLVGG